MTSEDLRLIQLAKIPPVMYRTGRVNPSIVRGVLLAIAVETDNGRHPVPRGRLAEACGMQAGSVNYFDAIVGLLAIAGLVRLGPSRRTAIGSPRTKSVSVDFERLRRTARPPACSGAPVEDPLRVSPRPAPAELFRLRHDVLAELGVGIAYVGKFDQADRNTGERAVVRAQALRAVREGWLRQAGERLEVPDLGRLFGIGPKSVEFTLKRYPAAAAGPDVPMYGTSIPRRRAAARSTP